MRKRKSGQTNERFNNIARFFIYLFSKKEVFFEEKEES